MLRVSRDGTLGGKKQEEVQKLMVADLFRINDPFASTLKTVLKTTPTTNRMWNQISCVLHNAQHGPTSCRLQHMLHAER